MKKRIARFDLDGSYLKQIMHMPYNCDIMSVKFDYFNNRLELIVTSPDLKEVEAEESEVGNIEIIPKITPIITQEQFKWDWNQ